MTEGSKRIPLGPAHIALGKAIRELRELRGKKLRDIESCSFNYLSEIENGMVTPRKQLVEDIARELGGNQNQFRALLTAVKAEKETGGTRTAAELARETDPIVEIIDDITGAASRVTPAKVDPAKLSFKGPFVTEEIDEQHHVSADRIVYKSIYSRLIRATEDGFQLFPWGFAESPTDLQVNKFQLGVRVPARIDRVAQIGENAYAVDFLLPHPLEQGDTFRLSFFKIIEATGYCDNFIGGSSAVEIKRCRIAVVFEPGLEPHRVWWFANLTPYSLPGIFIEEHQLHKRPTGQYVRDFESVTPATMVGIAWSYEKS